MSSRFAAVSVQSADFDPGIEIARLGTSADVGAVATFVGLVRGVTTPGQEPAVTALELEHYPGMTERSIADIVELAEQRWTLGAVRVIHRIGRLAVGDRIVFVGVSSRHRGDAFAACEFIMDYLKTRAPFWKKEWNARDEAHWVDARDTDHTAAARWS
ncbi:MAG: molybdenum cofactor biosynthesis protein MoaE [Spongiibacteraceae bacterium]